MSQYSSSLVSTEPFHRPDLDLTVSIVAYNSDPAELRTCLVSATHSTAATRVIVIDNSETDSLRKTVEECGAEYLHSRKNLGFGAAHNLAIEQYSRSSRYHLILNPDVYFDSPALHTLIRFMDENAQVGLVMPRVLYPDGKLQNLCKLLPTPADLVLRRLVPNRSSGLLRRKTERYELLNADPGKTRRVPVLSGCFMFLRTEVFAKVGVFDERFFMYLEDVDLCRRILREFDVIYYPHVSIFHGYAKGSYKTLKLTRYHIESACRYFAKWGWFRDPERESINKRALLELAGQDRAALQQEPIASESAIPG